MLAELGVAITSQYTCQTVVLYPLNYTVTYVNYFSGKLEEKDRKELDKKNSFSKAPTHSGDVYTRPRCLLHT